MRDLGPDRNSYQNLAHRNRSDFCDLRFLRCPSRTPEIAAISETRESNAALRFKGAMENRWRFAISGCDVWAQIPSPCGISGGWASSTRKSLAIAIVRFWCAKVDKFLDGLHWETSVAEGSLTAKAERCIKISFGTAKKFVDGLRPSWCRQASAGVKWGVAGDMQCRITLTAKNRSEVWFERPACELGSVLPGSGWAPSNHHWIWILKFRNAPTTAVNSMTSSERSSLEPFLKKEASPAVLGVREFWKHSGSLKCLEL